MDLKQPTGFIDKFLEAFGAENFARQSSNIVDVRKLADALTYARRVHDQDAYYQSSDNTKQVTAGQTLGLGPMLYALDQMKFSKD